jgi:NADH:ubiquinone oxidoreductase subunit 6 (subunit J)
MFEPAIGSALGTLTILYYFVWVVINIFAAIWIYDDAKKLPSLFINSKPIWWAIAALILGGIWVTLVYWAIHHSSFSNRENGKDI